jgi:hypothetical protein
LVKGVSPQDEAYNQFQGFSYQENHMEQFNGGGAQEEANIDFL